MSDARLVIRRYRLHLRGFRLRPPGYAVTSRRDKPADVGAVAARLCFAASPCQADSAGHVFEAGVFARLQLDLPAVGLGDGLDERAGILLPIRSEHREG